MKRKVIQLGGKTSVISLPSNWIKNYNIQKGDELNVEESSNSLIIKPDKQTSEKRKITIDIENFNERTLRYATSAIHKIGYDEITLRYDSPKLLNVIDHLTKNLLLGFIAIDQTPKKIVLKSISNEVESEFNSTLRRAFLVTNSLANSTLEAIESKNFQILPSLLNLENTNNQLTSFCLRLINKGFYKEKEKISFIVPIIWNLEKIADEYKYICNQLSKNNLEIQNEIIKILKETNQFFNSYYELVYNFSPEKLNDLVDKKTELKEKIIKIKPKTEHELFLTNTISTIISKTSDMSSSIFALNFKNSEI